MFCRKQLGPGKWLPRPSGLWTPAFFQAGCPCCGCLPCAGTRAGSYDATLTGFVNNGACSNGRVVGCSALNATFTLDEPFDGIPVGGGIPGFEANPLPGCGFQYAGSELDTICIADNFKVLKLILFWEDGFGLASYFSVITQRLSDSVLFSFYALQTISDCSAEWSGGFSDSSFLNRCNAGSASVTVEPTP